MPCSKMFTTGVKWSQLPSKICRCKEKIISEKIAINNICLQTQALKIEKCTHPPRFFEVKGSFRSELRKGTFISSALIHVARALSVARSVDWWMFTWSKSAEGMHASAIFSRKSPVWKHWSSNSYLKVAFKTFKTQLYIFRWESSEVIVK